jgi:ZIP family zinc transporter/zinc and cadmium transporter
VNPLLSTLIYSTIAGSATVAGLLLVLWQEKWTKRNSIYLISLAAGVLLTSAFIHLLPEAIELVKEPATIFASPFFFIIIGFALFYILEQVIVIHTCAEEDCDTHSFGIVAAVGIGFHSLLDGIVIGIGFEVNFTVGLITSLAVMLHELPEGIFTLSILLHAQMSLKKAVWYTVLVALATPIGALLAYAFIRNVSLSLLGNLLAVAAGSFLYIGASDLIPQTHRISRKANVPLVLLGGLFVIFVSTFLKT